VSSRALRSFNQAGWLLAFLALGLQPARGYFADCFTDGVQLYLSATVPAPTGHVVWVVADTALDGVPTNPPPGNVLGPDDVLILQDVVDGQILGDQPGRYSRFGIEVSNTLSNANIFFYLWNVKTNTPVGQAGQSFGVLNLGVRPPPDTGIGNAEWQISSPVFANQHRVQGGDPAAERIDFLQQGLGGVQEALMGVAGLLVNGERAAALAALEDAAALAQQYLADAQSPQTISAIGEKAATGLQKRIAGLLNRILGAQVTLADPGADDAKALKAVVKALKAAAKIKKRFLKIPATDAVVVLELLKSKLAGLHFAGETVCLRLTVRPPAGGPGCEAPEIIVTNLPGSEGLSVVLPGVTWVSATDFCVTMGPDRGAARVSATTCERFSAEILLNLGPAP
jgi:hypothetical protein